MASINNESKFPDYYEILECDRTASNEDLKKSYLGLVLSTHPDKVDSDDGRFLLIQKAWSVLRDPESRKVYDAHLSSAEHNNSELLFYNVISLKDMDCDDGVYTYLCRCGSNYVLEESDKSDNEQFVIIDCNECSFSLKTPLFCLEHRYMHF